MVIDSHFSCIPVPVSIAVVDGRFEKCWEDNWEEYNELFGDNVVILSDPGALWCLIGLLLGKCLLE